MPRLNKNHEQNIDQAVLLFLKLHPRATIQDVARQIGRSVSATHARMQKLVELGALERVLRVLSPATLPIEYLITMTVAPLQLKQAGSSKDFVDALQQAWSSDQFADSVCLSGVWQNRSGCFYSRSVNPSLVDGLTLKVWLLSESTAVELKSFLQTIPGVEDLCFIGLNRIGGAE
ncbi:MAG: winged helix-turn-helix domain-containing protein [Candidatus Doudnabacteria bacterium]|jgi:DNA-binding Lrp family transcriptional regulator